MNRSESLFKEAKKYIPGGVNSPVRAFRSVKMNPLFIQKANGKAKIICFAMGEKGKISRLLSPTFGAYLTYASVEGETETAPGQMTIQDMKAAYRVLGIK